MTVEELSISLSLSLLCIEWQQRQWTLSTTLHWSLSTPHGNTCGNSLVKATCIITMLLSAKLSMATMTIDSSVALILVCVCVCVWVSLFVFGWLWDGSLTGPISIKLSLLNITARHSTTPFYCHAMWLHLTDTHISASIVLESGFGYMKS